MLRWEQRIMLHAASGQTLLPAEVKVRLAVSAAELQQEAGLSAAGLRHLLDVAGSRCGRRLPGDDTACAC